VDRGIFEKSNPEKQFGKTMEEVLELHKAIVENDRLEIVDAIGDIQVTLILLSEMYGISYDQSLQSAYNVIKKRTGKMVNGVFVKDNPNS